MEKKWLYVLLALLLLAAIGLGVGLGVGLGTKHHAYVPASSQVSVALTRWRSSGSSATTSSPSSTVSWILPTSTPPSNAEYLIGGAIDPTYYSTSGAFNGSGIALASQSFARDLQAGTQGSLVMYFQHHSGDIRWQQLSSTGSWLGGSVSEVVAVDAKNNTPLSAVSYALNGTSTWHIFCERLLLSWHDAVSSNEGG